MQRIATVLAGTAGVSGRVYRSEPEAMERDVCPCVLFRWTDERAEARSVPLLERSLSVEVDAMVRGAVPDALADPVIQSAHALLCADPTLGGLAIDISLSGARFEYVGADLTAGKITHEYVVLFRHSFADMTN